VDEPWTNEGDVRGLVLPRGVVHLLVMMRTSYDAVAEPDVPKPVIHLVADLDSKHVDGHNRLRMEAEAKEKRLVDLERLGGELSEQLKSAAKRTTDVSALRFTPAMVFAIVAICASIVASSYASTWGLRDDLSVQAKDLISIKTSIAAQDELRRNESKLQDERYSSMVDAIKEIKSRGEMTDLKVNNLRETVLTRK
jgi:hypothetical protein